MHTTQNYGFLIPPKYKVDWYQDFINLMEQIDATIKTIENFSQTKKIKFWNNYNEFLENADINEIGLVKISPFITSLMVKLTDNYVMELLTTGLYLTTDKKYIQLMYPQSKLVLGWNIEPSLVRERFSLDGNIDIFGGNRFINSYDGILTLKSKDIPLITVDGNNSVTTILGNLKFPHPTKGIGRVLTCVDENGLCEWRDIIQGDNLGNHTATQNLNMNNFDIVNAKDIISKGVFVSSRIYQGSPTAIIVLGDKLDNKYRSYFIEHKQFAVQTDEFQISGNNFLVDLKNILSIIYAQSLRIASQNLRLEVNGRGANKVLTCINDDGLCEWRDLVEKNRLRVWNSYQEFLENAELYEMGWIQQQGAVPYLGIKVSNDEVVDIYKSAFFVSKDANGIYRYIQLGSPHYRLVLGWNINPNEATERLNVDGNIKFFGNGRYIDLNNNEIRNVVSVYRIWETTRAYVDFYKGNEYSLKLGARRENTGEESYVSINDANVIIFGGDLFLDARSKLTIRKNNQDIAEIGEYSNFYNQNFFQILGKNGGNIYFESSWEKKFSVNIDKIELSGYNGGVDIYGNNLKIDIPSKGPNKVLTCIDNNGNCEWRDIGGGGGGGGGVSEIYTFNCEQRGNAWGYGHFYKMDIYADNSPTRSLTSQYDPYPQNLNMCPFVAPENIRLVKITGTIYYCSVHAEQPTYPCFMRLRFQKNLNNTRQEIGDVLVQVQQANGWGNQNNLVYQQVNVDCESLNLTVNQGENWGVEFIGEQASNRIIQIRGVFLQIVARKI